MSKINGGVKAKSSAKKRRQRVVERLELQLKSGKKPFGLEELSDKDVDRIKKEITTLKTRI